MGDILVGDYWANDSYAMACGPTHEAELLFG